ncbi:hypothetical protein P4K49_29045 [Bacillus cereus]|nr:hypothetical protein [Bacillus thuringiensis]MEB9620147.1 hypothetical protein [Bacillus cereus]MEB9640412.1 hypothetical protein [Bacillus cereus]MEB9643997.1 hypothetical protein [Bacillus cereus]MEB9714909.1 hypothetical protein [Bacillus cereus]MEB9733908.1 hypothetical protein [Bacillus cereus]
MALKQSVVLPISSLQTVDCLSGKLKYRYPFQFEEVISNQSQSPSKRT